MTGSEIGTLVALAIADSTSIGTLVVPIWLMMSLQPRPRRILLYLTVLGGFYWCIGLVLLAAAQLAGSFRPLSAGPAWSWFQLVIGAVILAVGLLIDHRKSSSDSPSPRLQKWRNRALRPADARGISGLALLAGVLELAGMLPFLAAVGIITRSDTAPIQAGLTLGGYILIMVLPALGLLALRILLAHRTASAFTRIEASLERHTDAIVGTVFIVVGGLVAADAAIRLDLLPTS
ncbi:GAP family protein [Brevibacterium picturae]|uniref:GAP family protein n=1 Tax=Brevibacterium picturae TaxID=260553 RepID=A0ABP4LSC5_9MICO